MNHRKLRRIQGWPSPRWWFVPAPWAMRKKSHFAGTLTTCSGSDASLGEPRVRLSPRIQRLLKQLSPGEFPFEERVEIKFSFAFVGPITSR
jgi:hypothetical protein